MGVDWKSILKTVAPTLATALGGPLAGAATSILSTTLLGRPDGNEDDLSVAIASGSPDVLLKLKEGEQNFKIRMKELGIDLEKISADDRKSAREREVAVKDLTPRRLAYIFTIGFFCVLFAEFYIGISGVVIPDAAQRTLDITLGVLFAMMLGVKEYYFGSSSGSVQKSEMIDKWMKKT